VLKVPQQDNLGYLKDQRKYFNFYLSLYIFNTSIGAGESMNVLNSFVSRYS